MVYGKICSKCRIEKNEDEFTIDNYNEDKKNKYCKACIEIRNRKYRKENPEIYKEGCQRYYWGHREERMEAARKWQAENIEHLRAYRKDYYARTKMKKLGGIYA